MSKALKKAVVTFFWNAACVGILAVLAEMIAQLPDLKQSQVVTLILAAILNAAVRYVLVLKKEKGR